MLRDSSESRYFGDSTRRDLAVMKPKLYRLSGYRRSEALSEFFASARCLNCHLHGIELASIACHSDLQMQAIIATQEIRLQSALALRYARSPCILVR